jgi:hypothetical protein
MKTIAPSKRWTRGAAGVGLALTLRVASPARAEFPMPPDEVHERAQPAPAAGARHLIRLGPEVLLEEDEHGRVRAVDEPPPKPRPGEALVGLTTLFGILAAGAYAEFREGLARGTDVPDVVR